VKRYEGIKEDVYLAEFSADPNFFETLKPLGINIEDILVVIRPPANEALYHRFENELFNELLDRLSSQPTIKMLMLPRTDAQRKQYETLHKPNLILPRAALDGANLIAAADLVISAGGTMNREAAALGVPAATIYAGQWAAIDDELVREGRLQRLNSEAEVKALRIEKKQSTNPRNDRGVRKKVVELILDES
jgi:predicted glycosyltransferase